MPISGKRKALPQIRLSNLFDSAVICHPHDQAIFDSESQTGYTFEELSNMVNEMARFMVERITEANIINIPCENDRNGLLIAICMTPSTELIISLLAILKLEAAYVPIDVTFPASRVEYIIKDCRPDAILTNGMVENLKEATIDQIRIIDVTEGWSKMEKNTEDTFPHKYCKENSLFAVLYTSGSTSLSKGVKLNKMAVLNRLAWQWETFPYGVDEVCCFKTALTFVDSISEIYGPLLSAHQMIIIPRKSSVEDLVRVIDNHKVSRIVLVPSLLRSIILHCSRVKEILPHLRLWVCSGEVFPPDLLVEFFRLFNDGKKVICNFYGSTEILGDVTYASFDNSSKLEDFQKSVPIGIPIQNTEIYLVNNKMEEVANGTIGEILVTGMNLCHDNFKIEKADNFITNPFSNHKDYNIMYRTGDYAIYDKGVIYFEGRTDSQIKIRGHRIDIMEVQNCLQSIQGVDRGHVLCYHPGQMDQMLMSFYTAADSSPSKYAVHLALQQQLPPYMVPQVHKIDEMPLLVNEKIDQQHLLNLFEQSNKNYQTKSNIVLVNCPNDVKELAEILLHSCLKALGPSAPNSLSLDDSFFEIGGNSLNILLVLGQLQDIGYFIGIQEFITAKNFREILLKISSSLEKQESHFGMVKAHEEKYRVRPIQDEDIDEAIRILVESFCKKQELYVALGCAHEDVERTVRRFPWYSSKSFRKLSFVIYDEENGEIVGASLNGDLRYDIEIIVDDCTFRTVMEFVEFCETEAKKKLRAKKVIHSEMISTKETISSTENVKLIYIMERHIVTLAREYNYEAIISSNISPITVQICQDLLEYTVLGTFQANQWVAADGTVPFKNFADTLCSSVDVKYI